MTTPSIPTTDRPAADRDTVRPSASPAAGDLPPAVLARTDASEPAELAVVVVRGYN